MDEFEVKLLPSALKFYKKCSLKLVQQLNTCFETLEQNPFFGSNIKLLKTDKTKKIYRYRVGSYRIIYEIDRTNKKVGVLLISLRSSAYKKF